MKLYNVAQRAVLTVALILCFSASNAEAQKRSVLFPRVYCAQFFNRCDSLGFGAQVVCDSYGIDSAECNQAINEYEECLIDIPEECWGFDWRL